MNAVDESDNRINNWVEDTRAMLDENLKEVSSRLQYHTKDPDTTRDILEGIDEIKEFEELFLDVVPTETSELTHVRRKRQVVDCSALLDQEAKLQAEISALQANQTLLYQNLAKYENYTYYTQLKADSLSEPLKSTYLTLVRMYKNLANSTQIKIDSDKLLIQQKEAELLQIQMTYQANCITEAPTL